MQAAIEAQKSVELVDCGISGVREAKVLSPDTATIEWDRFMRISTTAEQVRRTPLKKGTVVLDVGGFDGALALFLSEAKVLVIDPNTTGGSGLHLPFPDKHFEVVVSIDALEHVPRTDRQKFLTELVRVSQSKVFMNYPEARSMDVQKIVSSVVDNKLIKEHVDYELPSTKETTDFLKKLVPQIKIETKSYVNKYLWMAWYVLFHTEKKRGLELSRFLKENKEHVSAAPHLYDLIKCTLPSENI